MKAHRQALVMAIAAATLTWIAGAALAAAPVDRQADTSARQNLNAAISRLSAGNRHQARDRLERAETALLNREVLDLGPKLDTSRPLPQTPAIAQIVNARTALATGRVNQAIQMAKAADQEVSTELASVP